MVTDRQQSVHNGVGQSGTEGLGTGNRMAMSCLLSWDREDKTLLSAEVATMAQWKDLSSRGQRQPEGRARVEAKQR